MPANKDAAPPDPSSLLSKSAEGATFLILLQIGSRALTFALNQLLLRYIPPDRLGISSQLDVYLISVLFFSREAFRVAIQRQRDTDNVADSEKTKTNLATYRTQLVESAINEKTQEVVNLAYISVTMGLLFAPTMAWAYQRSQQDNASLTGIPYFNEAIQLYCFAAFWELLAEPCFMVVQQKSEYKIRATAELVATVLRCVVTSTSVIVSAHNMWSVGVLPFALGQCTYGFSLLFVYYHKVRKLASPGSFSLTPRKLAPSTERVFSYFPWPLLSLGTSLFVQGVVKYMLTQGDVILISLLAPLQAQGIYALASNYGGLVARMVFQPIEESSRNYFGKLLSVVDGQPTKRQVASAAQDLQNLLKFYFLLSLSAAAVGPTIAPTLLDLIAGPNWTSSGAGEVLAKYCYYIPLLAFNGITEAFISAVANESELNIQSASMLVFSIAFAGAGFVFLQVMEMGAEGLVWANVINMACRIMWSWRFIQNYLGRNGSRLSIGTILPQKTTIAVAVATAGALTQVKKSSTTLFAHLLKSGLVTCCFAILLIALERQYLMQCYRSIRAPRM